MEPMSDKVKEYLSRKLEECKQKISKQKKRRKRIKVLYITTILSSIIVSVVVAGISTTSVPVFVIPIMSSLSGFLTAISSRFNFQSKKAEIKTLIYKLNQIQSKLDYVISCNGDLAPDEYQQILKDF
jgi:predicted nucleic acid-binding Zn ribbon protein